MNEPVGRRVVRSLTGDHRRAAVSVAVSALALALVSAAGPVLMAQAPGVGLESVGGAAALAAGLLVIGVLAWMLNRMRAHRTRALVADVVHDLRLRAVRSALAQDLEFYDRHDRAAVASRVTNDLESFGDAMSGLLELAQQLLVVLLLLPLMFVLEWRLALAALLGGVVIVAVVRRLGRITRARATAAGAATADLATTVDEMVSGLATLRAFGCSEPVMAAAVSRNDELHRANRRAEDFAALLQPALAVITGAVAAVLVLAGGIMVDNALITAPTWYLFVLATDRVSWLLASTGAVDGQAQTALAAAERAFDLIDAQPEPGAAAAGRISGSLRVRDLHLTYPSGTHALRGVTLDVPSGSHVGLVGPSGSGKSSLLRLLSNLRPASSGEVFVDDRPLSSIPEAELRAAIAYVPQRPQLFDGTIADNIRLVAPDLSDAEVAAEVERAGLAPWLSGLTEGVRTPVARLSGGERQVVALLRALAKHPRIVLLDEPTAHVDASIDAHLRAVMATLLRDVTCVLIAHRLDTIRDVDRVVVLREGRVTEHGPHTDLVAAGGEYAALHRDFRLAAAEAS